MIEHYIIYNTKGETFLYGDKLLEYDDNDVIAYDAYDKDQVNTMIDVLDCSGGLTTLSQPSRRSVEFIVGYGVEHFIAVKIIIKHVSSLTGRAMRDSINLDWNDIIRFDGMI